jgi:hypothetical protein
LVYPKPTPEGKSKEKSRLSILQKILKNNARKKRRKYSEGSNGYFDPKEPGRK